MVEGDGVEAVEALEVDEECDEGEGEEDGDHEPGAVEVVGYKDYAVADCEAGDENAEGDEDAELRGLAAAGFHQVDLLWGRQGAEIADSAVDEGCEAEPADSCEADDERGGMRDEGDDGIDEDEFGENEEEASDVFCEEDVAHAAGAEEVELDSGAVHAEGVVGEDGDAEGRVGDGDGKDELAEAAAGAKAAGEDEDHEEGCDEAVELVDVSAQVDELFFEAGDDVD